MDTLLVEKILERARVYVAFTPALPEVIRILSAYNDRITQCILDAMLSTELDSAWCGFNALYRWLRGWQSGALAPIPRKLIDGLLWIIDTRSEPGRLHALVNARHIVAVAGALDDDDYTRLNHALILMYEETAYEIATYSTSLTILRRSCLRLANAMKEAGHILSAVDLWLASVNSDRLPEVRYALQTEVE